MNKPNIWLVPAGMVRQIAPTVAALLEGKKFPGPFFYDFPAMIDRLAESKMQLWLAYDEGELPFLMMVTEIQEYPVGRVLNYCLIAGKDVRRVLDRMWTVEKWAMGEGAFLSTCSTRPKLATILRRYGFRCPLTTVYKPLVMVH